MIKRQVVTKIFSGRANDGLKIICCLGRIARDVYFFSDEQCKYDRFYNMGAMGNTLPFGLGLALVRQSLKFWVIEGDGSILMNLGGLVTYKRYNIPNLTLFILDNRQYETTGGQVSQPENFELSEVCEAIGLKTIVVEEVEFLESILTAIVSNSDRYDVVLIKTAPDIVSPRITDSPPILAKKFSKSLNKPPAN